MFPTETRFDLYNHLLKQSYDRWLNNKDDRPYNKKFGSQMAGQLEQQFFLPTLTAVKKGLFHIERDNNIHWDDEIRRLLCSAVAVQGVAINKIQELRMFEFVGVDTLKRNLKKFLMQAELSDVYGLKIDAYRLQSWNSGMLNLMYHFEQNQWINKELRNFQNLDQYPTK